MNGNTKYQQEIKAGPFYYTTQTVNTKGTQLQRVTQVTSGNKYLIVGGNASHVLNADLSALSLDGVTTIADNAMLTKLNNALWTATNYGNNWYLQNTSSQYLKLSNGSWGLEKSSSYSSELAIKIDAQGVATIYRDGSRGDYTVTYSSEKFSCVTDSKTPNTYLYTLNNVTSYQLNFSLAGSSQSCTVSAVNG